MKKSCGCSLLMAEGFSCSVDISNCNFWSNLQICTYFFLKLLVPQTLDPDWIWIRIRIRIQLIQIHSSGHNNDFYCVHAFSIWFIPYYLIQQLHWRRFAWYTVLVGFGRACAPVRCAHPSFWAHYHAKQGAARPPTIAALLLLIYPPKLSLRPELGPPGADIFPLG